MHQKIEAEFLALSVGAKIAVLSRTIHMETVHVRGAQIDHPKNVELIYQSNEFIHRLSGFISSLVYNRDKDWAYVAVALVDGIEPRGQPYLIKLHEWIVEAQQIV